MKTKRQLRRELIQSKKQIRELEDQLKDVSKSLKSFNQIIMQKEKIIQQLRNEDNDLSGKLKLAEDIAEKLFHVNDVLCAELQQDVQFIDMIRMAVEQLHTRAELLNRISGPLV